ncbi:hypothetical protein ABH09_11960 [Treponema sp. OMZ 803]|uniref:hypothetical protein n=1 Tax=Treponema sp. OMZ 803 TaxID=120682 RepID=UPI0020A25450|nr:hypothetical protein [Treponema sp. OMZ 803]UTC53007.1 hypothetical protein ABH09_11960 [Treponema sp. OMZ 803]
MFCETQIAPIILHGRKMMGTDPASCLNLPETFRQLYLEPVFFPHGQNRLRCFCVQAGDPPLPPSTDMDGGRIETMF